MGKPRVILNCVANRYTAANERIVEFSSQHGGGLISFREKANGRLEVNIYQMDPTVIVVASGSTSDDSE